MGCDSDKPAVQQIDVKVNNQSLSQDKMDLLLSAEVESSLYLPDMFILRFLDDSLALTDSKTFDLGATVEVDFGDADDTLVAVVKGEVTAIEPDFTADASCVLTIRGYDKRHRLNRGSEIKSFVNAKDSDIVTQLLSGSGLTGSTETTSVVNEQLIQHNMPRFALLEQLAYDNGYEVVVDDTKLYFRKPKGTRGNITLKWRDNRGLRSFRPRVSVAGQVNEVTVRGWDSKNHKEITGKATSSSTQPQINVGGWGGQVAKSKIAAATKVVVNRPVASQKDADGIAQGLLDEINSGFVEADGICFGNPKVLAGVKVKLENLGTKFSGTYIVTSARHMYEVGQVYETEFTVSGARPELVAELVNNHIGDDNFERWTGVVSAVVTNNKDPENRGRVKVKYPWLDSKLESNWARVCAIGAGKSYGIQWTPEVNDEVLVAFEHGDFNFPYVVGGLWNGKSKPPQSKQVDSNGKVEERTIQTREGHKIYFNDKSDSQKIEIVDAKGNTKITMDTKNKKITIMCKGDIDINADGNVSVDSKKSVTVKAGQNMTLEAKSAMNIKGANITVEAKATFTQKGKTGTVQTTGPLTLKGAVVNIN